MTGLASRRRRASVGVSIAFALLALLALGAGSTAARPAKTVTLTMVANSTTRPTYDVLIPNFNRVYPNIKVDVTYAGTAAETASVVTAELATGNAPDLFVTWPGCG